MEIIRKELVQIYQEHKCVIRCDEEIVLNATQTNLLFSIGSDNRIKKIESSTFLLDPLHGPCSTWMKYDIRQTVEITIPNILPEFISTGRKFVVCDTNFTLDSDLLNQKQVVAKDYIVDKDITLSVDKIEKHGNGIGKFQIKAHISKPNIATQTQTQTQKSGNQSQTQTQQMEN